MFSARRDAPTKVRNVAVHSVLIGRRNEASLLPLDESGQSGVLFRWVVEQLTLNQRVVGSSPTAPTNNPSKNNNLTHLRQRLGVTWRTQPDHMLVTSHAVSLSHPKHGLIDVHWRLFFESLSSAFNKRIWQRAEPFLLSGT
ncbi:MAG: hypothetical protein RJB62_548, partial [Pseudomonadota bacterium]